MLKILRSAGYPRSGQDKGAVFFWLVFFVRTKKMNTLQRRSRGRKGFDFIYRA
jgi:hypothetical protein